MVRMNALKKAVDRPAAGTVFKGHYHGLRRIKRAACDGWTFRVTA
jgi:hypothetical protein